MPSLPQPWRRESSCTSQSVNEPAVVTPSFFPLRSATLFTGLFIGTMMPHIARRSVHRGDRNCRHAFGAITHCGARTEAEVDLTGRHRLLELAVAFERRHVELESDFIPDVRVDADFERGERKRVDDGAPDVNFVRRRGLRGGAHRLRTSC